MWCISFDSDKSNTTHLNEICRNKYGGVENKISHVDGLVTAGVFNTKSGEVDNKIPDINGLVIAMIAMILGCCCS